MLAGTTPVLLAVLGATTTAALALGTLLRTDVEATCFGSQINHPLAAKIARNTVFVADVRSDGTVVSEATGFVVRGVNGPRIVTATHVLDPKDKIPETITMVFFSDGVPLGVPRDLAATSGQTISIADVELVVNDIAVLEIAHFTDAATGLRFARLDGLTVRAGKGLMVGETSGSSGVLWGYSGAPAIDRDGQVVGVVTAADFRGRTKLSLGAIQEADADGRPRSREVTLSTRSMVVVEPLQAPEFAERIRISTQYRTANGGEGTEVVLAGFPSTSCATTAARLLPADSDDGSKLLTKWQLMDQVGAWWMPPASKERKLRLAP